MDSQMFFSVLTGLWFMHSLVDALMMEDGDCMMSMRYWLVVSFVNMAALRVCLKVGQTTSHAKDNFIFSLRQRGALPRLMIVFIWCVLLPFSLVWTLLGSKWFYTAMVSTSDCSNAGMQPWLVGVWQLLSYMWVSIYVFYFAISCTIERRLRVAEKNMRQIETEDTLTRWGRLSPTPVGAEPFFASAVKGQQGLLPGEILALPEAEVYKEGKAVGNEVHCSICLSDFCTGEKVRVLPGCSHAFHQSCVDLWLLRRADCPLCKTQVQTAI